MELSLETRLQRLKEVKERFDISFRRIAEAGEIHINSVQHTFANKKYYVTESNVTAIETGMKKILEEYKE